MQQQAANKGITQNKKRRTTNRRMTNNSRVVKTESNVQGILVSHNIVKSMDENYPASLSPSVHDILRNKLGFTGVIMTDDLAMDAISLYTNGEDPAVLAVLAGNDILILSDYETSYNNLLSAAKNGQLDLSIIDKAVFRVLAWKYSANIIK